MTTSPAAGHRSLALATAQRLDAELPEQFWRALEPLAVIISDPHSIGTGVGWTMN